jgi:hypothetical protein
MPLSAARLELLTQSRRGLAEIRESTQQRQSLALRQLTDRRRQLDAAFDRDVQSRGDLSAQWVLDARRAYAVGLDALHAETRSIESAHRVDESNFTAIDTALRQAQALERLQQRLTPGLEGARP